MHTGTIRLIAIALISGFIFEYAQAQQAEGILLENETGPVIDRAACADQFAGTISLGIVDAQSNDVDLQRTFLCFSDRFQILHNGDADLTGDPDPGTPGGIGYAWYTCPPTVSGPDLDAILGDPCLLADPPPNGGIYIFADQLNGDAQFENSNNVNGQTIPGFFNQGQPVEIYFAPITYDELVGGQAEYEGNPSGPCVNVNTDEMFSVVYLNPIRFSQTSISTAGGSCGGSFLIEGGLPEFDGSAYSVDIRLASDPGVSGTPVSFDYTHGDRVEFTVPEPGVYEITIEDGKSCAITFTMDVNCDGVIFHIPDETGEQGDNICLDITVENFDSIVTFSWSLSWDPTILSYTGINFNIPNSSINTNTNFTDQGFLNLIWQSDDTDAGLSLADGSLFMQVCFDIIGDPGDRTPVSIGSRGTLDFLVVDYMGQVPGVADNGSVTVEFPTGLGGTWESCGSGPGDDQGSFTITAFGGIAPYQVDWTDQSGTLTGNGTITNEGGEYNTFDLPAGIYTVTITDANNDTEVLMVEILNGARPTATFSTIDPACADISNGRIEATVTAAEPHVTYWSNGTVNDDVINNLASGFYSATIEDNFGCETVYTISLETTEIEVDGLVEDAACESWANGSIIAAASGGTPFPDGTYTYRWQGMNSERQDTSRRFGLSEGTYFLTITDANNCRTVDSFTVETVSRVFVENLAIDPILCSGDSASIEISANTTNIPTAHSYVFDWSDNAGNTVTIGQNTSRTDPLPAGTYSVTLVDVNIGLNCFYDTTITLTEPPELRAEVTDIVGESCTTGGDASITVTATGGTVNDPSDYAFDWSNGRTGPMISNLNCGAYSVTVTDLNGCIDTLNIEIDCASPVAITGFDTVSISCPGESDGVITVLFSPFSPSAQIDWEDDEGNLYSGQTIANLDVGTYTVSIEAADGCVAVDSVSLGGPSGLRLDSLQLIEPSCPGESDGEIRVFVSGGSGNYSYNWSVQGGGPDDAVLPALSAGIYSVSVGIVGSSCEPLFIDNIELEDPPAVEASFSNIVQTSCEDSCDGQATVTPSGGPAMTGNYFIQWSSGETGPNATGLCPGENFVVVTDFICGDTFFIDIPAPEPLATQVGQLDEPGCFGDTDGSITVTSSGGTAPYNYQWSGGPADATYGNIGAGAYAVQTIDANGCVRSDTFQLDQPEELVAVIDSLNTRDITCPGRSDGIITVDRTGGNSGNTFYDWENGISDSDVAADLTEGTYTVTVSDVNGCSDEISITLTEPEEISASLNFDGSVDCFGETAPFTVDTAFGGNNGPFRYSINNGLLFDLGTVTDLFAGTYQVGIFDNNGCSFDTTITITQPAALEVDLGPDQLVNLGESIQLEPQNINSPSPVDSFIWSATGDILSCIFCPVTMATPVGEATVSLTVVNEEGCVASDDLVLTVNTRRNIFIPDAFSPNGDGVNDRFRVYSGQGVAGLNYMRIFNRWGDQVFERSLIPFSNNQSEGWDGRMSGKPLDPGVYVYLVEVAFVDGTTTIYKGEIHLIK